MSYSTCNNMDVARELKRGKRLYWMNPINAWVIFFAQLLTRSNLEVKAARDGVDWIYSASGEEEGRTKTPRQRERNAIKSRKGQQKGEIVHSSCDLGCRKESGSLLRRNFFRNRERLLITAPPPSLFSPSLLYFQGCFFTLHHLSVCQGCLLCTYTSTVLRRPKNKQSHLRSLKGTLQFRRSDCLNGLSLACWQT